MERGPTRRLLARVRWGNVGGVVLILLCLAAVLVAPGAKRSASRLPPDAGLRGVSELPQAGGTPAQGSGRPSLGGRPTLPRTGRARRVRARRGQPLRRRR